MRKVYVNENKTVEIGYNGENAAVALCFPFVELWHSLYGEDGTFSVVFKKPKRDEPYIKETFEDEKDAYCVIEEADVADIGYGYAVLIYSVGENVVARSKAYAISVDRSLLAGEDPVEPYQAYIDSILEAASNAINARTGAEAAETSALQHAQDAETSATNASTSATNASNSATSAEQSKNDAEGFSEQARQSAETVQNKLTPIHLYYDDTTNAIKDKDGNTLNYQQIYALTTQGNTQVTVNYSDFIYRLVGYYGNAIEFTNAYLYDGNEWSGRIIINSANAVRFDEVPNVHDVRINGTSITESGVADIPYATTTVPGLISVPTWGGMMIGENNSIYVGRADDGTINNRLSGSPAYYRPLTPIILDYAVKAAMTDGKGPAWTEAEQLAARQRIGADGGSLELIADVTLSESAAQFTLSDISKKELYFVVTTPASTNFNDALNIYANGSNYNQWVGYVTNVFASGVSKQVRGIANCKNGRLFMTTWGSVNWAYSSNVATLGGGYGYREMNEIRDITFKCNSAANLLPANTRIEIYGI